jgi:CDP-diglyceride synthetase
VAPAYATGRLVLLGVSALCAGGILTSFLRAPVLAVDEASFAVYRGVLADNIHAASPSLAAVPLILDVVTYRLPPGYSTWLVAYAALVVVTELIAYVRGRRPLPPGDYGVPFPTPSTVDWSPPDAV